LQKFVYGLITNSFTVSFMIFELKKFLVVVAVIITALPCISGLKGPSQNTKPDASIIPLRKNSSVEMVYDSLHLDQKGLSRVAFDYAISGYKELKSKGILHNDSVLTIIDFDQPSYNKRMYIIDIKNYKLLFNTLTAHGRNTGLETAKYFSNSPESFKSSLGLYITDQTYNGKNGYSLKLKGLEKINNNAMNRAIVLHGAPYVSQRMINSRGYIGRSHGCPAVPQELNIPIIEKIKGGSCFFIYNNSYHSDNTI